MTAAVIRVDHLGKRYRVGRDPASYRTLRESVAQSARRAAGCLARVTSRRQPEIDKGDRREFWALRDASFEVRAGEVLGVIGRNGAGKSTLLKLLSQITEPTEGALRVRGRAASLLEVGTGFHPELTGRENVLLNGAILGMPKREILQKFDEIVEFAEVERFIDTPVKRYSSGMYLRLAFSVAAHLEPEILMVDEVLAVGDAAFQQRCLGKMGRVAGDGRTVLLVTHNMAAVRQLCTRALCFDRGTLVFDGDVESAVNRYLQINRATGPSIDLTDFESKYGRGEIRVESISMANNDASSFSAPWDQPLQLRVRLTANEPVREASVAIGIQTGDGFPIFTVRTADQPGAEFSLREGQTVEVTGIVHHNLRAGHYNVVVGVHSGNYVYYYNPTAAPLEISEVGQRPYLHRNTGAVNCEASWDVSRDG